MHNIILGMSNPVRNMSNPILSVSNPVLSMSNPILSMSNPILSTGNLSQGFWSGGDFGPGGPKSPGSGQIKRSGPGILVRALKSLSSFVYQCPCMFQLAACTPGLPDEVK